MINLSGPIRDESLTPDRVTTLEDMAEFRRTANMVVRAATALISVSVAAATFATFLSSWRRVVRSLSNSVSILIARIPLHSSRPARPM